MKACDLRVGEFVSMVISVTKRLPSGALLGVCSASDAGIVSVCQTSRNICVGRCRVDCDAEVYIVSAGGRVSVFVDVEV